MQLQPGDIVEVVDPGPYETRGAIVGERGVVYFVDPASTGMPETELVHVAFPFLFGAGEFKMYSLRFKKVGEIE